MTTSRRIAFLDIDGTILAHDRTVQASTAEAIRRVRAAGHLVFLCTGRADCHIPEQVAEIGFDGGITNSGAFARSGGELVLARPIDERDAQRLVTDLEARRIAFTVQTDDALYVNDEALAERFAAQFPSSVPLERTPAPSDQIAKIVFFSDPSVTVADVRALAGERFHVVDGSVPLASWTNGEITARGTTKGDAVTAVLAHVGMDADDAIGIGDSWNDVEMFEVCGTSVAMGNAAPELQAMTDLVTTSVDDDGVWNAFVSLGLLPESSP